MESSNVSGTLKSLFEGSGSNHVTGYPNLSDAQTTPSVFGTYDVKSGLGSTLPVLLRGDAAPTVMKTDQPDLDVLLDDSMLLRTNILLIAVLVVCFITLISVVALCGCFLRRYCKNRRISQSSAELFQTTLVTKATSITGLNVGHEYYSTKVEKNFSPTIIAENKCNKATECELDGGGIQSSHTGPSMVSPKFNPMGLEFHVPPEEVQPIYFKMKNVLTSTPASTEHLQINGHLDSILSPGIDCGVLSPTQRQNIVFSMASPQSIYTSALSNQQVLVQNSQPVMQLDASTAGLGNDVCCLTKGPGAHSVSWFVPLNGGQREPLRHSVVDLFEDELAGDITSLGQGRPPVRNAKKSKKFTISHSAPLTEEAEIPADNPENLQLQDVDDGSRSEASTAVAENAPLVTDKDHLLPSSDTQSHQTKRSRLKSTMSENGDRDDDETSSTSDLRTRSLSSPDEKTMWKQREERPVLFLGSSIE